MDGCRMGDPSESNQIQVTDEEAASPEAGEAEKSLGVIQVNIGESRLVALNAPRD